MLRLIVFFATHLQTVGSILNKVRVCTGCVECRMLVIPKAYMMQRITLNATSGGLRKSNIYFKTIRPDGLSA